MFCPNCGNQINDDVTFCPFCGSKILRAEPAAAPEPTPEPAPAPAPLPQTNYNSPQPAPAPAFAPQPQTYYNSPQPAPAPTPAPIRARVGGVVVMYAFALAFTLFYIAQLVYWGSFRNLFNNIYGICSIVAAILIIVFGFITIKKKPNLAFIPPAFFILWDIYDIVLNIRYASYYGVYNKYLILGIIVAIIAIFAEAFFAASINPRTKGYKACRVFATIFIIIWMLLLILTIIVALVSSIHGGWANFLFMRSITLAEFFLSIGMLIGTYSLREVK